jgi:predicted  nucleic acid-binding Zn-ribbon protein
MACFLPLISWSRSPADTLEVNYDSIQDLRVNRLESRFDGRMDRLEVTQDQLDQALGEMASEREELENAVERLHDQVIGLEEENRDQSVRLDGIDKRQEETAESTVNFRARLRRTIWILAVSLLLLMLLLSAGLFLLALRTGKEIRTLGRRQKKLGRRERELREELDLLRSQEKSLWKEIRKERRARKSQIRKAKKSR